MSKINLDNPQTFQQTDPDGMLDRVRQTPELCQKAWQMAMKFDLPPDYSGVDKVVILGMGGSAIGGDLAGSLVIEEAKLPVFVCRGYDLPAFVDKKTLVIASSYSGMTEETLSSFQQALKRKSKNLVITTGGELKNLAVKNNVPVFTIDYQSPPRAALAFSFMPILCILQKLGFVKDKSADVAETISVLKDLSSRIDKNVPESDNRAKQLAQKLYGHLPAVYGAGIAAEVAYRWKTQFNENGKAWAFSEVFPELNHNAVVGYQFPADLAGKLSVILLRAASIHSRIQLRYQVTCQLLEKAGVSYHFVDAVGNSQLSQMLSLVLLGDYVSCYLAILYQTDPSPVKVIDYLKQQLAKQKG